VASWDLRVLPRRRSCQRRQDKTGFARANSCKFPTLDLGPRLLTSGLRCGCLEHALPRRLVGVGTTALGLAFALIATRTNFPLKRAMRVLSVLPIITPPFVIGLALILLFGRSARCRASSSNGSASRARAGSTASGRTHRAASGLYAHRLPGAHRCGAGHLALPRGGSQTLRAKRWTTFFTVTLPLMRPGLANAFLLGFVESMADFGNPLVLGGNFEVLSTKIFFAVVGAAHDQGRAAVLSIVLLGFTLGAFWVQHAWLGKKVYTTVTGKGDSGPAPAAAPPRRHRGYATALPWALFTFVVYVVIAVGGFVRSMGRDLHARPAAPPHRLPDREDGARPLFSGSAWDSFFATVKVAALAAPAHRGDRAPHGLSPDPPALLRASAPSSSARC
jgi:iron(III) transport system permease protein